MSELSFAVGQRWVSNSEAELGLGIVSAISGRRIEVDFPAVEESRTYAADNAPLSRVTYGPGEKITTNKGATLTVEESEPINGCFIYFCLDSSGKIHTVPEMNLTASVQFSQPQQRLFAGQIDKNNQFNLRLNALSQHHRLQQSPLFGLLGARAQLLPHQFYIAAEVGQRHSPRVLLADEVGLGKTIEAGLILHQQLLTGRAKRVLIIVPESLLHQWLVEMLRRFNLWFTVMDVDRYEALLEQDESNPYESSQLVLSSLQDLQQHPQMQADLLKADWDLLVVDEAHHLHWHPENISDSYQLISTLASQIPGVLLLTATPQQLGMSGHFARLKLLDPKRYFDLEKFEAEQAQYQPINDLLTALLSAESAEDLSRDKSLMAALAEKLDTTVLAALVETESFTEARQQAKQQLLDQFGTGRILFRNTREVIRGFPPRQLHRHSLLPPADFSQQDSDNIADWLRPEQLLDEDWLFTDPRVNWLTDFLKQHRGEKILLICALAETAQLLEQFLRLQHGVRSAVFHEGLSLINRDRAAAYFADEEAGAQLLICSEIGSEGRNFQFCHQLICFDLPISPDLLEQRIGRLDRIGQRHEIQIHVPYYKETAQQRLLEWYHEGLNAFEKVQTAGEQIKDQLEVPLIAMLKKPADTKLAVQCLETTRRLTQQTNETLKLGRDRLLEMNSFDADKAEQLIAELEDTSRSLELADFMADFSDAFGIEQQAHSADSIILQPSDQMLQQDLPGLPEDGLTATFQRNKALIREDMAFLSWEHPLVRSALDSVISSDCGNSAFCFLASTQFPAGQLLLESIYILDTTAPASLQLPRYLPQQFQRFLVDEQGQERSEILSTDTLSREAGRIPKNTAQQLVSHARNRIDKLLSHAKSLATQHQQALIDSAQQNMRQTTDREIDRLQQLAKVNPDIRPTEIERLIQNQQEAADALQTAQLRLDAIRVVIVTEPN